MNSEAAGTPSRRDEDAAAARGGITLAAADGRVIRIKDGDVVGRTATGKEILEIYEEISRRHAQFILREGSWFVVDLGSSNGTFLDGKRLAPREQVPLRDGQHLELTRFFPAVVKIEGTAAGAAPGELRDEPGGAEQNRRIVVILFGDLKGSVDFFQEKGTIVAQHWIVTLYRMLSAIIEAHRGIHVKNIGDAILAVFDDPHEAAKAAVRMQADIREHNAKADNTGQYHLRIGMNMGSVLFEDRDVFGNAVNIASRVQSLAPPDHIYMTRRLYDEISGDREIQVSFIGDKQLKGVKGTTGIYEIICG